MADDDLARPSGTVYGRGGVHADARTGPPTAMIISVAAGAVAVLGLGYAAWNSTGGSDTAVAATLPAVVETSSSGSAESSPATARLTTGSWLLSPLGDPNTYLTVDADNAEMSPADPATLIVQAGLADDACFSFRLDDGRFLRHYDYRLRFDAADDSELFRADATFCQEDGTTAVRLRSKNYPDHLVHRRDDGTLYIDKPEGIDESEGAGFTTESSFMVQEPS